MNMNMKQTAAVAVAILATALAPSLAVAFSPPSSADAKRVNSAITSTVLEYRSYDGPQFYDVDGERTAGRRWSAAPAANRAAAAGRRPARRRHIAQSDSGLYDVDSDRTTLWTLLDPPAPPFVPVTKKSAAAALQTPEARQASLRAASKNAASAAAARRRRPSPIVSLLNVEDYEEHVLHSPNGDNAVCVVRFKAPWCQTCRTTNVAWERMASRITKLSSADRRVKFFSVELDGKEETLALKDRLGIEGVPQGVLHHPARGISERRVKLTRSKLSGLKKNLERYCTYTRGEEGLQSGMLLDGMIDEE